MDLRDKAVEIAFEHFGKPYKWGGQGPFDFDCSGFIIHIFQRTGVFPLRQDDTAQGLFKRYSKYATGAPYKATVAFYGKDGDNITHCTFVLNKYVIIGANGGNINRISVEDFHYRKDLISICDPYMEKF